VPEDAVLPPGCDIQMDLGTGTKRARLNGLADIEGAAPSNGAIICAHCREPILQGEGCTAITGETFHKRCRGDSATAP
jgi:hypothetical protein